MLPRSGGACGIFQVLMSECWKTWRAVPKSCIAPRTPRLWSLCLDADILETSSPDAALGGGAGSVFVVSSPSSMPAWD